VKYIHFGGYEVSRMGHLYAGFRDYHRKFSTPLERQMADLVLRVGLLARILVYRLCYLLTKNERVGQKCQQFGEVWKNWAQLRP
jgi:hypothetical protein